MGVLFAAFATGTTYFTQQAYSQPSTVKWGDRFNYVSIGLVIASYIAFAVASYITYSGILTAS